MASMIFEYAVILDEETDRDGKTVEKAEIVVPVTTTLAKDENQAQLIAARAIPEDVATDTNKLDRLSVVVRPF